MHVYAELDDFIGYTTPQGLPDPNTQNHDSLFSLTHPNKTEMWPTTLSVLNKPLTAMLVVRKKSHTSEHADGPFRQRLKLRGLNWQHAGRSTVFWPSKLRLKEPDALHGRYK